MPRHPFCTDCLAMSPFVSVLLCSFFIRLISSTFIHPYFVLIEALIVGLAILASLISGDFLICFPTTTVLCRSFRIWFQSHSYQHRYCYSRIIGLIHSGDTLSSLLVYPWSCRNHHWHLVPRPHLNLHHLSLHSSNQSLSSLHVLPIEIIWSLSSISP